jgi:hypothetical protein
VHNLAAAATTLLERAAAAPAGRVALTLVRARALRSSRRCWRSWEACTWPSTTFLGRQRCRSCRAGCGWWRARRAGSWGRAITCRSRPPGTVGELGGRCRPLYRGRDLIQLRETPGNLSGSGSETHQHFSPTGASCCYSLLLDPHATMTLTCTNGCSCWSPDEENSPQIFLTMDALYRLS